MTYYRLWDKQCGRFMATGYNASTKQELFDDYQSYKSNDWDETETESDKGMHDLWKTMTDEQKMDEIRADEFDIEKSEGKFDESIIN